MRIVPEKLHKELEAAGIPIEGCDETGRIAFRPTATMEQRAKAAIVLSAHVPTALPSFQDVIATQLQDLSARVAKLEGKG
jgi:hypothetical protein